MRKETMELLEPMKMFYSLIEVVVTGLYIFVKTH